MLVRGLKSKIITPKGNLLSAITHTLKGLPARVAIREGDVLVIASKVVAITQGRTKKITGQKEFKALVEAEADQVIGGNQVTLTMKNGIFIPWAGVDRSNTPHGTVVLWPKEPFKTAGKICSALKTQFRLKKLGVIITDSFCAPLRRGVTAVALGYAGFYGVNDLRGTKDLYGNKLKVSQQAIADMIATAAHLVMGESNEQTPFAIVSGAPVVFTAKKIDTKEPLMNADECLYQSLYKKLTKRERKAK
ncbi:MAG TPA: coenzyme F420-0:L-glutamate ligase [Candidatus Gracilibacteria bacterium]|nr:coenzyme F420-0:L-glutamate ligase [Candidatus Gracilibacteria bacterium]